MPGLGRSPGGEHGYPLQYSCLENYHGQKSLMGYSPWGRKESDTTEQHTHTHTHTNMCVCVYIYIIYIYIYIQYTYTFYICIYIHSIYIHIYIVASLVAQMVKRLPSVQETWVRYLGWEDPLEKEMATHSNILAWRIPWTEEPVGYIPWGRKKSDTTEQLHSLHSLIHVYIDIYNSSCLFF